jgi:hypothetical protein
MKRIRGLARRLPPFSSIGRRRNLDGLVVRHIRTETDLSKYQELAEQLGFEYVCCYRTEVTNSQNRRLRIRTFEGYSLVNGTWQSGNILGRRLNWKDFCHWYNDGDQVVAGWIEPGATAVCDANWHSNNDLLPNRIKWTFEATDEDGDLYVAEAEVPLSLCD